jgi:hypothetical protein
MEPPYQIWRWDQDAEQWRLLKWRGHRRNTAQCKHMVKLLIKAEHTLFAAWQDGMIRYAVTRNGDDPNQAPEAQ